MRVPCNMTYLYKKTVDSVVKEEWRNGGNVRRKESHYITVSKKFWRPDILTSLLTANIYFFRDESARHLRSAIYSSSVLPMPLGLWHVIFEC